MEKEKHREGFEQVGSILLTLVDNKPTLIVRTQDCIYMGSAVNLSEALAAWAVVTVGIDQGG